MKRLTSELMEKAKMAKSAEELLAIAKANGVEMTADEAKTYFEQLNPKSGELDDDALDGVAGGCGANNESPMYACPYCGTANVLDWALGDTGAVECCTGCGKNFTVNANAQVK